MENIVLVDGDIVVYRVGFASQSVSWEYCQQRVDTMLSNILTDTDSMTMYGYLTDGVNNFRNKVAVTAPYKGNRPGTKPLYYNEIRKYLHEYHGFSIETAQEADDAIGIANAELSNFHLLNEYTPHVVIASIDKDLLMLPGYHYNIAKGQSTLVYPLEATHNFYKQVLIGDRVDNIIGIKGLGPVKAEKLLAGSSYYLGTCECAYRESFGEVTGSLRLLENLELLWIRQETTAFQVSTISETYKKWEVL